MRMKGSRLLAAVACKTMWSILRTKFPYSLCERKYKSYICYGTNISRYNMSNDILLSIGGVVACRTASGPVPSAFREATAMVYVVFGLRWTNTYERELLVPTISCKTCQKVGRVLLDTFNFTIVFVQFALSKRLQ